MVPQETQHAIFSPEDFMTNGTPRPPIRAVAKEKKAGAAAKMNLAMALAIKEDTFKDFLTDVFARRMTPKKADEKIAVAFRCAEAEWKDRLVHVLGEARAQKVFRLLSQTL
jgi:hypothetical protein